MIFAKLLEKLAITLYDMLMLSWLILIVRLSCFVSWWWLWRDIKSCWGSLSLDISFWIHHLILLFSIVKTNKWVMCRVDVFYSKWMVICKFNINCAVRLECLNLNDNDSIFVLLFLCSYFISLSLLIQRDKL